MFFSKEISKSLTLEFAQAARAMKSEGKDIISLGLGEPDFKTPGYINEATINALEQGYTNYSAAQGLSDLRRLISLSINNEYGSDYKTEDVIITPGAKAAIYMALASLLEPFDEVLNITPYYVSYPSMVKLAEPTAEIVDVALDNTFSLDIELLKKRITDRTKCLLINSPHNPTGMVFPKETIEEIISICIENNIYIVSDEVYDKLIYPDMQYTSFASYTQIKDRLVIVNGYSKSHAMTGWRLGYALAPKSIMMKMNRIQQNINTNTCTFIQKGACAIYTNKSNHLDDYLLDLKKRMTFFHEEINKTNSISGIMPKGGFFYFADISKTNLDSNSFCVKLLNETGIASTPGIAFGYDWDNYVRFSVAVSMEILKKAIILIRGFDEKYNG